MTSVSRTRTRGQIGSEWVRYYTETCSAYALNGQFLIGVGQRETMTDTVVKGFHKRVQRGELFFNPMTKAVLTLTSGGGSAEGQSKTNSCSPGRKLRHRWEGCFVINYIPLATPEGGVNMPLPMVILSEAQINSAKTEAVTSMLNSRGRSDVNLFETIAEMDQTLGLLSKPFATVERALAGTNNNYYRGWGRRHKDLAIRATHGVISEASAWYLTWRYGISPALKDIVGVLEGLSASTRKRRKTTRGQVLLDGGKTIVDTVYPSHVNYIIRRETSDVAKVRAMSLDEVQLSVAENIGFTGKGLLTLPWELVSKSFVADWFLNLGDLLGALVPVPSWNHLGSALVVDRTYTSRWTCIGSTDGAAHTVASAGTGWYERSDRAMVRGPLVMPGIVVKSDFKFDKATRLADAAALFAQQILRFKR